jgi:hypothetical protein
MRAAMIGKSFVALATLVSLLALSSPSHCEERATPGNIRSFIGSLVGEWVGTYQETTDGVKDDSAKYFRTVVKQSSPDSYETVFEYYSHDAKIDAPLKVGSSTITTNIVSDRLAASNISGYGQALVDAGRLKPERHQLSEVLHILPSGDLQGTGRGTIAISGLPMGLGKNGKVTDYQCTWSLDNGVLKIKRQLKLKFKVLCLKKSCTIVSDFTARPGSDIAGLINNTESNPNRVRKAL